MNIRVGVISAFVLVSATFAQAKSTFVVYDRFLNLPALCYRLDDGWQGLGWVNWNIRGDTKFEMSVILMSPSQHMLFQDSGPSYTRKHARERRDVLRPSRPCRDEAGESWNDDAGVDPARDILGHRHRVLVQRKNLGIEDHALGVRRAGILEEHVL